MSGVAHPNDRGFTMVEFLIAAAVFAVLAMALLQFAELTQRLVRAQGDLADLNQRARVVASRLYQDLVMAGAGPWNGARAGSLAGIVPGVRPWRAGALAPDPELTFSGECVSILYVPDTRVVTRLTAGMAAVAGPLVIDAGAPGCPANGACGFNPGDRAIVIGDAPGSFDVFTVAIAGGGLLTPAAPLGAAYPAGSPVAAVAERTYYLDRADARLMMYDGALTDSIVLDQVSDLRFTYFGTSGTGSWEVVDESLLTDGPLLGHSPRRFDADVLRIRRVRVSLTLEAQPGWRQWAGWTGRRQLSFDVSPRNLGVRR
jgi:prepilin-type N-terminal cleavage/methylation domain-containing protein